MDVPMHNSQLVEGIYALKDLLDDGDEFEFWELVIGDEIKEGSSVHLLADENEVIFVTKHIEWFLC
jgi:hypothetical protein